MLSEKKIIFNIGKKSTEHIRQQK